MPRPTRRPVDKTRIEVSTPSLPRGRRSSGSCVDQFINARFRRHPLGDHRGDNLKSKTVFCPLAYRFADEDRGPVLLVQTLKASRQVHAVPECCIIHTFRRPHVSHHRLSGMNAKATVNGGSPSVSNWALRASLAALAERAARQARST